MSGRSARARRFTSVAAIVAGASVGTFAATSTVIGATTAPTTTVAGTSAPTTGAPTTPTTAAGTAAPGTTAPTTFPGPAPRQSARVASPIDIEKIRATSLPFRAMSIAVGVTVVLLAIAGFVYGKLRSRIPAVKAPKPAIAGDAPMAVHSPAPGPMFATPLPPPIPIPIPLPLPPPPVEDALSDTVIFEPPPSHHAPQVITAGEQEAHDDTEPAEIVDGDSGETEATPPDGDPTPEKTEAPERD